MDTADSLLNKAKRVWEDREHLDETETNASSDIRRLSKQFQAAVRKDAARSINLMGSADIMRQLGYFLGVCPRPSALRLAQVMRETRFVQVALEFMMQPSSLSIDVRLTQNTSLWPENPPARDVPLRNSYVGNGPHGFKLQSRDGCRDSSMGDCGHELGGPNQSGEEIVD